MPELPSPKAHRHPWRSASERVGDCTQQAREPEAKAAPYAELCAQSNFTFLTGASHPDELVRRAAELDYAGIAVTDSNTLAGVVRGHLAAAESDTRFVVGARLVLLPQLGEAEARWAANPWHAGERPRPGAAEEQPGALVVYVYPTDRAAFANLCTLLTTGKRRAPKGHCFLTLHDLLAHHEGLLAAVKPPATLDEHFLETLAGLGQVFGPDDRLSLVASRLLKQDDAARLSQLAMLSQHLAIPLLASNDVCYHDPRRRPLADVLTCIRLGCTLDQAGRRLDQNAERYLKSPAAMADLFAAYPEALARTVAWAQRTAGFSLKQLRYDYPDEIAEQSKAHSQESQDAAEVPAQTAAQESQIASSMAAIPASQRSPSLTRLIELTWRGAAERYPAGLSARVRKQIEHEFTLIAELYYAPYFLTVHDIVQFARARGILCQGRGAAANSAVCYCLGITAVDPERVDMLFERFVSRERNEPPDIDIDFEHERREEVIQYIYGRYGRDRAALTAEVITYRPKSAVRDVGKALGLSLESVDRLAKQLDWWDEAMAHWNSSDPLSEVPRRTLDAPVGSAPNVPPPRPARAAPSALRQLGFEPADPTIRHLMWLVVELQGFPRHLSQHVGGFVITAGLLSRLVPIENASMVDRTIIEWDKDDIDALGILKIDILGLGMLTAIRKTMELVNAWHDRGEGETGVQPPPLLALHTIPAEEPAVYDMISQADTVGVFQIESRAQMSMLPRLRPRCYYDLVIEVAIVRPGPIQGQMVHPYLRRRNGEEAVTYPDDAVRAVLGKTLGVPLFQEQAMQLAIVAAGFTPGEADQLRRAIAAWRSKTNVIVAFGLKLVRGMVERGYPREFAERCFEQIKGFSEYGFPESHAASFALLVYVSSWLKYHYPAAFAAALINSQPMGFYAPAQILRDAGEHGVTTLPIDVNFSAWDCTLEAVTAAPPASDDTSSPSAAGSARRWLAGPGEWGTAVGIRLGMRLVKGLRRQDALRLAEAVAAHGPFRTLEGLWRTSGVAVATMKRLAGADAFGSMGLTRQQALWQVRALRDQEAPLWDHLAEPSRALTEPDAALPAIAEYDQVMGDYRSTSVTLRRHPVSFLRNKLRAMGATPAERLHDPAACPDGRPITVAGIVLVRQRPSTASGIVFFTLEDETGVTNLIVRPKIMDRYRRAGRHGVMLLARGKVERQGDVVHVMVDRLDDLTREISGLASQSRDFH